MSDLMEPPVDVEQLSLRDYAEKAYLDYSMYVILDRALPHVGDGLKPVQLNRSQGGGQVGSCQTVRPDHTVYHLQSGPGGRYQGVCFRRCAGSGLSGW